MMYAKHLTMFGLSAHAGTWRDLEGIMLNEIPQIRRMSFLCRIYKVPHHVWPKCS